jgi:hypothetical protein
MAILAVLCGCDETQQVSTAPTSTQRSGDSGLPGTPGIPAVCRASCDEGIGSSSCQVGQPLDATLESIAEEWGASDTCGIPIISAVIGDCEDGTHFIFRNTGHTSEVRYFNGSQFIALATTTDTIDRTCLGQSYWPSFVTCEQPVASEVLCGSSEVGDSVLLPWSEEVTTSREATFPR